MSSGKRMRWLSVVSSVALVLGVLAPMVVDRPSPAAAVTGSQFNPELIIADSLFYDSNAMSAAAIQLFLNGKIGTCLTDRCLNVIQVTHPGAAATYSDRTGNLICNALAGGTMPFSQFLYRVQGACGISAKVILATLQKEQGLVTNRSPSDSALRAAMGMACPDTAPCDTAFAGLATQVYKGAAQLKVYKAGRFAKQPGYQYIQYNPNSACGGTYLTVRNYATAALYSYTPYQPNAAALANLTGIGDGCSAYGNRNFWRFYSDWFGSVDGLQFVVSTLPEVASVSNTDYMYAGYLIMRDQNNALWAYPSNAAGDWAPRVSLGAGWAGANAIIGVGDLDGNGFRDLIARDSAGKAWFYPGDGRLDSPVRRAISADWSTARLILYGGYFDANATPDMLTIDSAGDLWRWPGNGAGQFGAGVKIAGGFADAVTVTGLGDFDGDRCGDLVSITSTGQMMLYRSDCAGRLQAPIQIGSGFGGDTTIYSAGDFTADGIPDLWVRNGNSGRLYRGTGGGQVASTTTVEVGWNTMQSVTSDGMRPGALPPAGAPLTASVGQAGVGDLDGDGKRDFLGVTSDGKLRAFYGNGSGIIGSDRVVDAAWGNQAPLQFPLGDFTGDGRPDVGIITRGGDFLIAKGNSSGFDPAVLLAPHWDGLDAVVGGFDWDGDGKPDVLARSANGDLWVYRGNGTGGWASTTGLKIASGWNGYLPIPVGNFDGTGGTDILALQSNGDLWLYRGNGSGGWASTNGTRIGTSWTNFVTVFSPGDFDGNAGTDLLARAPDGTLYLYSGDGMGRLRPGILIDSGWGGFNAVF